MPSSTTRRPGVRLLPALLIVLIGVCYAIITSTLGYLGDDLAYFTRSLPYAGERFYLFPKFAAAVWTGANGRLQKLVAVCMFQFTPGVLVYLLNGAITVLLFWFVLKWSRVRSVAAQTCVVALVAFALPWWDVFLLFVVNIGYCWAMAMALVALWYLFEYQGDIKSGFLKVLLALVGVLAGGMHEACGVPLCFAVAVYLLWSGRWRGMASYRKWILGGMALGVLYTLLSPALWMRAGGESEPDGPWWLLLGYSSYFVGLLIVAVAVVAVWRKEVIAKLIHTPWSVFVIMALASLPIVVMGGIVGRAGFFGQVSALIALCWLCREAMPEFSLSRGVGMVLAGVVAVAVGVHYVEFTRYQLRLNAEVAQAVEAYKVSADGAVYMDFTNEPDMPWYLLRKTRGVPDEDDFYLSTTMTRYLGAPERPFTVLPEALRGVDADTLTRDLPLPKGYVTRRLLGQEMPESEGRRLITSPHSAPWMPDSIAVPLPGGRAWYVTARDLDPSGSY